MYIYLHSVHPSHQIWTSNNIRNGEITNVSGTCDYNSTALVFGTVERSSLQGYGIKVTRSVITDNISLNDSDLLYNEKNYCEEGSIEQSLEENSSFVVPTEDTTINSDNTEINEQSSSPNIFTSSSHTVPPTENILPSKDFNLTKVIREAESHAQSLVSFHVLFCHCSNSFDSYCFRYITIHS